jgi:hypothetical protein
MTRRRPVRFGPSRSCSSTAPYPSGETIDELVGAVGLHSECVRILPIDKTDSDLTGKGLVLTERHRQAILKSEEGHASTS